MMKPIYYNLIRIFGIICFLSLSVVVYTNIKSLKTRIGNIETKLKKRVVFVAGGRLACE